MKEKSLLKGLKKLGGIFSKNSSTILTIIAVGGLGSSVIFAVRVTPEAVRKIEQDSRLAHNGDPYAYTKKEAIKSAWKFYIPTGLMSITTISCIIGSNAINRKRNAALATMYGLSEVAFREYKEKVVETIGKGKELAIRDDIAKDKIEKNPPGENEIIFTGKGDILCYDSLSGRYFKSDIEKIRRAINEINHDRMIEDWVSLNDVYYELGLSPTKLGDQIGWKYEQGLFDISFSTQLTENNEPCLVLNYDVDPKYM